MGIITIIIKINKIRVLNHLRNQKIKGDKGQDLEVLPILIERRFKILMPKRSLTNPVIDEENDHLGVNEIEREMIDLELDLDPMIDPIAAVGDRGSLNGQISLLISIKI